MFSRYLWSGNIHGDRSLIIKDLRKRKKIYDIISHTRMYSHVHFIIIPICLHIKQEHRTALSIRKRKDTN